MKTLPLLVMFTGLMGSPETDFVSRRAAMLITRSDIYNVNGGKVLKNFSNVIVSRHELDDKQSYFILDADDIDNSVVRSIVSYEEKGNSTRYSVTVDPNSLMDRLKALGVSLPETMHLTSHMNDIQMAGTVAKEASPHSENFPSRTWYVLKGNAPKGEEEDTATQKEEPSMRSIMIRFGSRKNIEEETEILKRDGGPRKLYDMHYMRLPLKISIRRTLPNGKTQTYPEAEGFYFAKHLMQGSGFLITFGQPTSKEVTGDGLYLIPASQFERGEKEFKFEINADAIIQYVIGAVLGGDSGHAPPLECMIPSDEASQKKTACKGITDSEGKNSRVVIQGTLDFAKTKKVEFWLKSKLNQFESYKCTLEVGAEDSLPEVAEGTQVTVVSPLASSQEK